MTAAELRERIMAALRARASDASVRVLPEQRDSIGVDAPCGYATWGEVEVIATGATELDALAALAVAVGLDADGADPRAEVERLRAALAVATRSLEAASSGERLTTCDELARLSREVVTVRAAYASDLAGLRAEVRRADDERAAWRGLRDAARGMLTALEAPAPVWDADESEHDAHAARLTAALDAVRALVAP